MTDRPHLSLPEKGPNVPPVPARGCDEIQPQQRSIHNTSSQLATQIGRPGGCGWSLR